MKVLSVMQVRPASNGMSRAVLWLLLAATMLLLSSPASHAAKVLKVKAAVTVAEDLNPDYQGRPSPVNIIVFQLVSADAFSNADFFSLFEPEAAVLGGDMEMEEAGARAMTLAARQLSDDTDQR